MFDRGKSCHSNENEEKFLQMGDWFFKGNKADEGYGGGQAGDPEDEVDDERMVELHRVAGQAEIVIYHDHVPQVDAVAEPGERLPGPPGQEDVDRTAQPLLTCEDDPGDTESPGQPVEAVVEGAGSGGYVVVRVVSVDVQLVAHQAVHHGQAHHGGKHLQQVEQQGLLGPTSDLPTARRLPLH